MVASADNLLLLMRRTLQTGRPVPCSFFARGAKGLNASFDAGRLDVDWADVEGLLEGCQRPDRTGEERFGRSRNFNHTMACTQVRCLFLGHRSIPPSHKTVLVFWKLF